MLYMALCCFMMIMAFSEMIRTMTALGNGSYTGNRFLPLVFVLLTLALAAGYFGATNRYGTISLASAASQAALTWEGEAHSPIADARMTAGVVNAIAAYHLALLQEQERLQA